MLDIGREQTEDFDGFAGGRGFYVDFNRCESRCFAVTGADGSRQSDHFFGGAVWYNRRGPRIIFYFDHRILLRVVVGDDLVVIRLCAADNQFGLILQTKMPSVF